MEYVIFPMKTITITQRHYSSPSHQGLKAIDIAGEYDHASGINETAYAPTTCKVLNKKVNGSYNTVLFGTCDEFGNEAKVMCEDGVARVLTYALTHSDDISEYFDGKIYLSGQAFYKEGTFGANGSGSLARHIHFEVAEGWKYTKKTINGVYQLEDAIFPHQIFHQLSGWNIVNKLNGYTMATVSNRNTSGVFMNLVGSAARIRSDVMGAERTIVAKGGTIEVIDLYDWKAGDGYRWGWGIGNGISGAFQYDPNVMYPLGSPNPAHNNLWMKVLSDNVPMYYTISGSQMGIFAHNGSEIRIIEFVNSSWFYGEFQDRRGYFLYNRGIMFPYGNC